MAGNQSFYQGPFATMLKQYLNKQFDQGELPPVQSLYDQYQQDVGMLGSQSPQASASSMGEPKEQSWWHWDDFWGHMADPKNYWKRKAERQNRAYGNQIGLQGARVRSQAEHLGKSSMPGQEDWDPISRGYQLRQQAQSYTRRRAQ